MADLTDKFITRDEHAALLLKVNGRMPTMINNPRLKYLTALANSSMSYQELRDWYLCDNGCYHCADVNGNEQHRYALDNGTVMFVTELRSGYTVQIFSTIGDEIQEKSYYVHKESWQLMLAEEAYEHKQHMMRNGRY